MEIDIKDFTSSPERERLFCDVLDDALRQCQLLGDYEKASSRWLMVERMAIKMGVPPGIVLAYGERLISHFEQQGSQPLVAVDVNSPGNQIVRNQQNHYHQKE